MATDNRDLTRVLEKVVKNLEEINASLKTIAEQPTSRNVFIGERKMLED